MEMASVSSRSTPRHILKGDIQNTGTLTKLWRALNIHYSNILQEILPFIRQSAADDWRFAADPA